MNAPPFEVADIVRAAGKSFIEKNRSRLNWQHLRVLRAIERCRTAALGGHLDQCSRCGHQAISYNSCRNRHCAKCQTNARDKWLAARKQELLNVPYVHVVFTLPHQLSHLALANKRVLYDLLFRASAATLLEIAADAKHLGADIGFMSVLHTWGQNVLHHPHIHCVIPAGGLSLDRQHWVHLRYAFFLPVKVLSRVFRGKFTPGLKRAFRQKQLTFPGTLAPLAQERAFRSFASLVVPPRLGRVCQASFRRPAARSSLPGPLHPSRRHLQSPDRRFADGQVTFRWKDYAHGSKQKLMTVTAEEFLRRFLLHVLPHGFVRIRFFGFLANRRRKTLLPLCRQLLRMPPPSCPDSIQPKAASAALWQCPRCGGSMLLIQHLTVTELKSQSVERRIRFDSS